MRRCFFKALFHFLKGQTCHCFQSVTCFFVFFWRKNIDAKEEDTFFSPSSMPSSYPDTSAAHTLTSAVHPSRFFRASLHHFSLAIPVGQSCMLYICISIYFLIKHSVTRDPFVILPASRRPSITVIVVPPTLFSLSLSFFSIFWRQKH